MVKIPKKIYEIQNEYRIHAQAYIDGETEFLDFKHKASPYGVYAQKNKDTYMIRPRIFSGVINLEQLKFASEVGEKYSQGFIHLTTRQDIQFHKLSLENTIKIFDELHKYELINHGAGGNSIRNIACSPLSGVDKNEVFDVSKYAELSTEFILGLDGIDKLPRKYKIAFSNSDEDTAYAKFSDLGFIAKIENEKKGFKVYAGGGLGSMPDTAMILNEFINETEILDYIKAMKSLFEDHGDRTNRARARIRHIKQRLGDEEFRILFYSYYDSLQGENKIKAITDERVSNDSKEVFRFNDKRINTEKRDNYYSIYIHPVHGDLKTSDINKVIEKIESLNYEIEIRLTSTQGVYLRSVRGEDVESFIDIINDFTGVFNIDNSVICTGAKNCKIGLQDSQGLIRNILSKLDDETKELLPKLFISGCHNSCGWHHIGLVGFSGAMIKENDKRFNAFKVHLGGSLNDSGKVAVTVGTIKEELIPEFLTKLGKNFKNSSLKDFELYINKLIESKEYESLLKG